MGWLLLDRNVFLFSGYLVNLIIALFNIIFDVALNFCHHEVQLIA
jgi:hypothetical protein